MVIHIEREMILVFLMHILSIILSLIRKHFTGIHIF